MMTSAMPPIPSASMPSWKRAEGRGSVVDGVTSRELQQSTRSARKLAARGRRSSIYDIACPPTIRSKSECPGTIEQEERSTMISVQPAAPAALPPNRSAVVVIVAPALRQDRPHVSRLAPLLREIDRAWVMSFALAALVTLTLAIPLALLRDG
jgi:hypothetical protein